MRVRWEASFMDSAIDLDHLEIRLKHGAADVSNRELASGRRWTLLQALAWIATEFDSFVELVGSWTPAGNTLPNPNASRAASLELAKQLRTLTGALSLPIAQVKLFSLLSEGSVVIYVEHTECVPIGVHFSSITYNADFMGLHPAPDDRYWGYVVVEAESLRLAWAASKPSPPPSTSPAMIHADEPQVAPAPQITRTAILEIVDTCVRDRLGVEPTRKAIDETFPGNRLTRARIRQIHADRWESQHGKAPTRGANARA
jgi:hypothetical protein